MTGIALAGAAVGAVGAGVSAGVGGAASAAATRAQQQMAIAQMKYLDRVMRPYRRAGEYGAKREQKMADLYAQNLGGWTDQLRALSSPYTMEQYQQSPLYTPMVRNLAELQATPGYQFEMQQGQQNLAQQAAARGGLLSGAQQKAAMQFGQRQASTGFQDAWKRAQAAYGAAFSQDLAQKQNAANLISQQSNLTSQAAGLYGGMANRGLQAAGTTAAGMAQQGQQYSDAAAAGAYGKANAINQGVQGLLGAGMSIYGMFGNNGTGYQSPGGPGSIY